MLFGLIIYGMADSKNTSKSKSTPSDKELVELGKKLQSIYETGYADKRQSILFSFYKGVAAGFGAFLGGTILIAILIWILNLFSNPWADRIINSLTSSPK